MSVGQKIKLFFEKIFISLENHSEEVKRLKKEQEIIKQDLAKIKLENQIFRAQQAMIEKITEKSRTKTRCQKVNKGRKCNKSIHAGKFCIKHKTKS